jgi:hypothetical protein
MGECKKARKRPIPFDCKAGAGHEGPCTPYTLPPRCNYLTDYRPVRGAKTSSEENGR